jgi:hypothetical protein
MSKAEIRALVAAAVAEALAQASKPAPEAKPAASRKPRKRADASATITATAEGFTFAWTREKVKANGVVQYRLVITGKRGKTLTYGTGMPYAVREDNGTLAEKVARDGVSTFALSRAKSLAK